MPPGKSVYSHAMRDVPDTEPRGSFRAEWYAKNVLLHRPNLGTTAYSTRTLPSDTNFQHAYGLPQVRDGITADEVLGEWNEWGGTGNEGAQRDFKKLNKDAATMGCKTNKDITAFRQTNDARLKVASGSVPIKKAYDETTTFGCSTSQTENMWDIYSGGYRYDWASKQPTAAELVSASKPKKPGQTKTSILAAKTAKAKLAVVEVKKQWKLPSFDNVPAKLGQTG